MKTIRHYKSFIIFALSIMIFTSCLKDELEMIGEENEKINTSEIENSDYSGFEFKTTNDYTVTISVLNGTEPIHGVYMELYTVQPLTESGTLVINSASSLVYKGMTDKKGELRSVINLTNNTDSLYILTHYIGLNNLKSIKLIEENIEIVFNTITQESVATTDLKSSANLKSATIAPTPTKISGYYRLGAWDTYGVPDYLEPVNDQISTEFLDDINASLPEYLPLPQTHPQYLTNTMDANLILKENCEIWVTLVHEGAGWHNSLGYYTYQTNNAPQSIEEITDLTLIFPDVSIYDNGLTPGNKVQLYYLDTETNSYSSEFPAGISVGWFLIARGWSSTTSSVNNGIYTHYSNIYLNNESDLSLKKHNVLLYDEERELLLLGFEDVRRDDSGCDQDFNDAVFYTTVSPITAVENNIYQPIDDPLDSDNDGTSDVFDEFPNDPERSFSNYYPGEGEFGTLVFEDLWPYRGDYDFNDLVIDYNFSRETNAQNQITAIRTNIVTRAIGASYHNAFGIKFNTPAENIKSVTGQRITKSYLDFSANGTEAYQQDAVIIVFDDAYNALPYPGEGVCVNTYPEYQYVTPDTIIIDIDFNSPILVTTLGTPPYNPFIIINRERGKEVHLPGSEPTDLADESLFGTGDDDTDVSAGKYYMSDRYLPWAINIPESFNYPIEKVDIRNAYLVFNNWATSMGFNYMDWYIDNPDYRNEANIYP